MSYSFFVGNGFLLPALLFWGALAIGGLAAVVILFWLIRLAFKAKSRKNKIIAMTLLFAYFCLFAFGGWRISGQAKRDEVRHLNRMLGDVGFEAYRPTYLPKGAAINHVSAAPGNSGASMQYSLSNNEPLYISEFALADSPKLIQAPCASHRDEDIILLSCDELGRTKNRVVYKKKFLEKSLNIAADNQYAELNASTEHVVTIDKTRIIFYGYKPSNDEALKIAGGFVKVKK